MKVESPLLPGKPAKLVAEIPVKRLTDTYWKRLKIDVNKFFHGQQNIQIYECETTGFRFYYPFNLDGDGPFYGQLQQYDWYYLPWKWEHELTIEHVVKPGDKVLEIGSGGGGFMKKLKEMGIEALGLEINATAVEEAKKNGLPIILETIGEHQTKHPDKYDVVCSFQVVEHIADIRPFLEENVGALKSGGKLVISVPNNDSFIKDDPLAILNMPPHHMGLWTKSSLTALEKVFPLKVKDIYIEPLQPQHYKYYHHVEMKKKFPGKLGGAIAVLTYPFVKDAIAKKAPSLIGQTIMAVYTKL